jgi:hypothetical protein
MFDFLTIDRMIVHEVFKREAGHDPTPPNLSTVLENLDPEGLADFRARVVKVMGKPGKAVELTIDNANPGSAIHIASDLMGASVALYTERSCEAARLLARSQLSAAIPGGLLVVFEGTAGQQGHRIIGYLKAETQSGFTRKTEPGQTRLEYVKEILLTPATRLYKVGIFVAPAAAGPQLPSGWRAFVFDDQIVQRDKTTAAKYFYEQFLGCRFREDAAHQVREFYRHSKEFITKIDAPEVEKVELYNALVVYLRTDQSPTIQVADFGERYLQDAALIEQYESYMEERSVPTGAILKDLSEIAARLRTRKVRFSGALELKGTADQFNELVSLESIEGDVGPDGAPAEWTLITVKDRIRSQE